MIESLPGFFLWLLGIPAGILQWSVRLIIGLRGELWLIDFYSQWDGAMRYVVSIVLWIICGFCAHYEGRSKPGKKEKA